MKTCILSYHWKLDICNYEAFIKHRIVSIVKVVPTKMLSSFWGGAIAPAVPIAFPSVEMGMVICLFKQGILDVIWLCTILKSFSHLWSGITHGVTGLTNGNKTREDSTLASSWTGKIKYPTYLLHSNTYY